MTMYTSKLELKTKLSSDLSDKFNKLEQEIERMEETSTEKIDQGCGSWTWAYFEDDAEQKAYVATIDLKLEELDKIDNELYEVKQEIRKIEQIIADQIIISEMVVKRITNLKFKRIGKDGYYIGSGYALFHPAKGYFAFKGSTDGYPYQPLGGKKVLSGFICGGLISLENTTWVKPMEEEK